jgi:hypothetical protein
LNHRLDETQDDDHRLCLLVGVEVIEDHVGRTAARPLVLVDAEEIGDLLRAVSVVDALHGETTAVFQDCGGACGSHAVRLCEPRAEGALILSVVTTSCRIGRLHRNPVGIGGTSRKRQIRSTGSKEY